MQIGVVGAGGVGGYFALRWAEAGRDVVVLARGDHLHAIRERGLEVRSPFGDAILAVAASDDPSVLGEADLVVFATKTWQLPSAARQVLPHLRVDAVVMGLQNGVESITVLGRGHPEPGVLGGTCRVISYVERPGVIRHLGVEPTITFGEPRGGRTARVTGLAEVLHVEGRATAVPSKDIVVDLWRKFIPFSAISGVGSLEDRTIGAVMTDVRTRSLVASAITEAAAVGRALGVRLGPEVEARALSFLDTVPDDGTSSMHRDFKAGRRTELEALSGYLSRSGRSLGIPTPTHDRIYEALLPLERAARGETEP